MPENGFLQTYQQTRKELQHAFTTLGQVVAFIGTSRLAKEVAALQEKLRTNQFNLVVMGQFKRGKSTLINALLEKELLPTAVVPLTSVVTQVQFGESPRATVYFLDGQARDIPLQSVAEYTTESQNPQNKKQVERVEIEYPAEILRDGVRLIDTPGVGSVFEHNTSTAYEFLPRADAVLFLVTADPPISEAELRFLADVREYAGKIFFVKNKIDHLSPQEVQDSLAFTREVLARDLQIPAESVRIFPVSARWALQGRLQANRQKLYKSGLPELEKALSEFLLHEKGQVLLQNSQRLGLRLLREAGSLLELERKAITLPQVELEQKIEAFRQYQSEIQHQKDALEFMLKGGIKRILSQYDEDVERFKQEKLPELSQKLTARFQSESRENAKSLASRLENALREALDAVFIPWREQQTAKINRAYKALANRLVQQVNRDIDQVYATAGELFDLHLQRYEKEEQLGDEKFFYFKYDRAVTMLEDFENLLTYTMATLVSKNIILKKLQRRLPELFDRQCGRIRADFFDRLRESSFALQRQLEERLEEAYTSIQTLVQAAMQRRDANAAEMGLRLQELQRKQEQIAQIRLLHREMNPGNNYEAKTEAA